jgi:hypothetical protein
VPPEECLAAVAAEGDHPQVPVPPGAHGGGLHDSQEEGHLRRARGDVRSMCVHWSIG